MDRSVLAARIQEILKGRSKPAEPGAAREGAKVEAGLHGAGGQGDEEAAFAARCAADEAASAARDVLGGDTIETAAGRCLVVERRYDALHVHGRHPVERYASAIAGAPHVLRWFLGEGPAGQPQPPGPAADLAPSLLPPPDAPPLLFFDLETTGLSGGAGTYAFLVGCARFDGSEFVTRQFFLRGYGEERALLEAVRAFVEETPAGPGPCLVTYNGRAFDVPLIETRYLVHRRQSPFASMAHVDMLFAARRLWKQRPRSVFDRVSADGGDDLRASCALTALEQDILGLQRLDDVPGWEIPARYFAYTRTGDARGLVGVLEHNRLDLISLAAVTGLILEMAAARDHASRSRYDCLAIARLLDYLRRGEEAERCFELAAAPDGSIDGAWDRLARAEALHWLALHRRRARRFGEAADAWRALLQIPGLAVELRREACEALAVHHEHRAKDLQAARTFALRALDVARGGRHAPEVEHRLDRLHRKLGDRALHGSGTSIPTQPELPGEP